MIMRMQALPTEAPHILVVDDHRDIRESLSRYLQSHGYRVSAAANGEEMKRHLRGATADLVILDIMMPGEDGLSLCRHLRETSALPVILLTAVAEDTDRIIGLEMGADDYLTKPFNPRELLARIRAVMRRSESLPQRKDHIEGGRIYFDGWTLDSKRRELRDAAGVAVALSTGEYRLLVAFLNRPGMVLSRDQLLDITRGRDAHVYDRSVDNQVSRLRQKIEADPSKPQLVKTVWGGGYQLTADVISE